MDGRESKRIKWFKLCGVRFPIVLGVYIYIYNRDPYTHKYTGWEIKNGLK